MTQFAWTFCIPIIQGMVSAPYSSCFTLIYSSILDLRISVMTRTHFVFTPTASKGFRTILLHVEKKSNQFEMPRRSPVPIAFVTARQACRLVSRRRPHGPALFPSSLADDGLCMASLMHRVQGQTGSSAHNHNGWPHPIPIAFPLTGGKIPWCILLWLRQI